MLKYYLRKKNRLLLNSNMNNYVSYFFILSTFNVIWFSYCDDHLVPHQWQVDIQISQDNNYYNGSTIIHGEMKESSIKFVIDPRMEIHKVLLKVSFFPTTAITVSSSWHVHSNGVLHIKLLDDIQISALNVSISISYSMVVSGHSLYGIYSSKCNDNSTFLTGLDLIGTSFPRLKDNKGILHLNVTHANRTAITYRGEMDEFIGWVGSSSTRSMTPLTWSGGSIISPCLSSAKIFPDKINQAVSLMADYFNLSIALRRRGFDIYSHPNIYRDSYAMHNAIIVRENYLSFEDAQSSQLVYAALARQWLSLKGSDVNWLSLGLSQYLKHEIVAQIWGEETNRKMWNEELESSLEEDCLRKTKPLAAHYDNYITDPSSYIDQYKAAFVLRMLELVLGKDRFKIIIKTAIFERSSNETLINALFRQLKLLPSSQFTFPESISLADVLMTWINQPGYPVITVIDSGSKITLNQESAISHRSDSAWWIPITISVISADGTQQELGIFWLSPGGSLTINIPFNTSQPTFNNNVMGYYRFVRMTSNLCGSANSRSINDMLAAAKLEMTEYPRSLGMTRCLNSTTRLWNGEIISHMAYISESFQLQADRDEWAVHVLSLVTGYENSLTAFDNSTKLIQMKSFLETFCDLNFLCDELYQKYTNESINSITISNWNISDRGALLVAARQNHSLWHALMTQFSKETSQSSKSKLLEVISVSTRNDHIESTLNKFLSDPPLFSRQEFVPTISNIVSNEERANLVWKWMTTNWNNMTIYMPGNMQVFSDVINSLSKWIFDRKMEREIKEKIKSLDLEEHKIGKALELMRMNCHHREKLSPSISRWLRRRDQPDADFMTATVTLPKPMATYCTLIVTLVILVLS